MLWILSLLQLFPFLDQYIFLYLNTRIRIYGKMNIQNVLNRRYLQFCNLDTGNVNELLKILFCDAWWFISLK